MRSPAPPSSEKKSVTKWDLDAGNFFVLKPKWYLDAGGFYLCGTARELRSGAPPRPPCSSCTLLHTATRPPITQPAQETVLGSAVPSLATLPAPCFQGIHSGLRQVRFLRKLMPGEGFCMHVLCYLLKALQRYVVPAAIATCCHDSIRAFLPRLTPLTVYDRAVLSA